MMAAAAAAGAAAVVPTKQVSPHWCLQCNQHTPHTLRCPLESEQQAQQQTALQQPKQPYSQLITQAHSSSGHQVVLESHTRNKKKCVTTVTGLEGFGVKLSEAAKLFGKKFACGASVVKNATGTEQIDMQVGAGLTEYEWASEQPARKGG